MQPYLASLPEKSQLYNKHVFQSDHLPLLQDLNMVRSYLRSHLFTGMMQVLEDTRLLPHTIHEQSVIDRGPSSTGHMASIVTLRDCCVLYAVAHHKSL